MKALNLTIILLLSVPLGLMAKDKSGTATKLAAAESNQGSGSEPQNFYHEFNQVVELREGENITEFEIPRYRNVPIAIVEVEDLEITQPVVVTSNTNLPPCPSSQFDSQVSFTGPGIDIDQLFSDKDYTDALAEGDVQTVIAGDGVYNQESILIASNGDDLSEFEGSEVATYRLNIFHDGRMQTCGGGNLSGKSARVRIKFKVQGQYLE